ncbi:MAG: hypothetical protein U0572_17795 [Phycisphaerales bacterium]
MPLPLARLIASSVSLVAFAVAIAAGLSAGNPADAILTRALVAMFVCFVGGYFVGLVTEHVVRVQLRKIDAETEREVARLNAPESDAGAVEGEAA